MDKISRILAKNLLRYYPNIGLSENKVAHGIIWTILNPVALLIILLIGVLTNNFYNVIMALGFVALRLFSGGKHIENTNFCFFVSIIGIVLLSLIHIQNELILNAMNILSLILVTVFAPNRIEFYDDISFERFIVHKIFSISIVLFSIYFNNPVMILAIFIQSLTLLDKVDKIGYNRTSGTD